MVNSVCNIIVKGLVREKWSSSLRMWRQPVFPRSQTGWRPPSGETIARLQAGECRCLSVTPWICGYIVCYCVFCVQGVQQHQQLSDLHQGGKDKCLHHLTSNSNIAIQYRHRPPSFIFDVICFVWKVGKVRNSKCNSLYGRDVARTGKFCAGGKVDACQVITT